MRVSIHAPQATAEVADRTVDRVRAALERYGQFIREASVRLTDENGPRGGVDQSCVVRVALRGAPDVTIRERGERPLAAVGAAMKRVRRAVSERINARARIGRRERRPPDEPADT